MQSSLLRLPLPALLFLIVVATASTTAARAADDRPPNLILIMADDLGAKELGCYGHPRHRTPHLDRLAQTGVQFDTCYTACICHPTRFEIMTGQYGSTNGVYQFAGRPGGPDPDAPEEQIVNHLTFGTVLQQAGYATAQAGKWQLTGTIPNLIVENGFNEYCMWAYKHNLPPGVEHTGGWEGRAGNKTSRYWHPSIVRNGQYVPTTIDDYGPDIFAEFVIDFARRNREQPFFIYYPMVLTHSPWYATPASNPNRKDKFRNSKADYFGENVEYMDTLVGRIVAAIDELELREETIILFTGDNGTGGEGKGQPTELGARVPMIVNGPTRVKPIGLSDALVDTSDVMPTLVELAGASLPKDHPIDGHSFAPILRGERSDVREWIFSYVADKRVLRTSRYLLERNSPENFGTLYDCGNSRDGSGYVDVTSSEASEVDAVRKQFREILATKPVPEMQARRRPRGNGGRE
jgi:arylsulfatase A